MEMCFIIENRLIILGDDLVKIKVFWDVEEVFKIKQRGSIKHILLAGFCRVWVKMTAVYAIRCRPH